MSYPPVDERPLGLTVHSTPSMQTLRHAAANTQQRKGRWRMLAVLLVCAAPVVASYWTYYVIRPEARRNFGELVQPPQPMPEQLLAQDLQGQPLLLNQLKGQWLLVSVSDGSCGASCENHLYLQRQLRESLGREKERLDWVWFITDGVQPAPALQAALSAAQVLHVPAEALQTWLQPAQGQALQDHLYVVDPQGHWMLRYPAGLDVVHAGRAKRDLDRLLRASSGWDQPGRTNDAR